MRPLLSFLFSTINPSLAYEVPSEQFLGEGPGVRAIEGPGVRAIEGPGVKARGSERR